MDIEPTAMSGRKTLDLIQNNEIENRTSLQGEGKINRSSIFEFLYFWSIFLLSISFFFDLAVYFCFYQKKNNGFSYNPSTFFIRIITDALFIAPLMFFIRYALTSTAKNYIIGIIIFLPQLVLSSISIIGIEYQEFLTIDDIDKKSDNETLVNFTNLLLGNSTNSNETKLTNARVRALKISPIINLIIYMITVILSYLKVIKNF